jgi:hypothetical protein
MRWIVNWNRSGWLYGGVDMPVVLDKWTAAQTATARMVCDVYDQRFNPADHRREPSSGIVGMRFTCISGWMVRVICG